MSEALAERKVLADIVEATDTIVQMLDLQGRWMAFNRAAPARRCAGSTASSRGSGTACSTPWPTCPSSRRRCEALWQRALDGEEFVEVGEFGDPARERRTYEIKFNTLRGRDGAPSAPISS